MNHLMFAFPLHTLSHREVIFKAVLLMLQRKIVSIFKSDLNTSGPFLSLNGLIYFSYVGREAQFALVENLKIIM